MTTQPVAGPSLPPHLLQKTVSAEPDSDSEDDFMPALPPNFDRSQSTVIGPSLPPPGFSVQDRKTSSYNDNDHHPHDDDDDDDEGAGPMPLAPGTRPRSGEESEGVKELREREQRQKELERLERDSKKLKREEWMLLPPQELDLAASVDPTKIKSRGFKQTSKPHSAAVERNQPTGSLWTETPVERNQRLADEAMGKRRRAEDTSKDEEESLDQIRKKKRDRLMREQVQSHNKSNRGESLLELHQQASSNVLRSKTTTEKEIDKKNQVVWDHDSMMGLGGKLMTEKQKSDLIRDSKNLGGRFGGGSFL